nr:murein biosynthesis integral membrane protein MurJ [Maliibacterium massiliense]
MADSQKKTFKAAFSVTFIILISKCFGFLRDMILASTYGTSVQSDAYYMAFGVVSIMAQIVTVCITATFVPVYSKVHLHEGPRASHIYTSNVLNLFFLISILMSGLAMLFAPQLLGFFAPGFDEATSAVARQLYMIMAPSIVFTTISAVFSALLNARERFVPPQLVGFPMSLCIIAAALLFSKQYGIYAIAVGMVAATFCQILIQLPFSHRIYRYHPYLNFRDPYLKQTFVLAVPAFISVTINEINQLVDRSLASGLPTGSLTALSYGYKLLTLVHGVIIVAITTILFQRLSQYAAEGNRRALKHTVRRCNEIITMIVLPIIAISLVMNKDIIRIVYQRGSFGEEAARMTRDAFVCYIVGVLPLGIRDVLNRAFYSLQNTRTPMIYGAIGVATNIVLNLILVKPLGLKGLAIATSAAFLVNMVLLFISLHRQAGRLGMPRTLSQVARIVLASALCGGVAYGVSMLMPGAHALLRLALATLAGGFVYIISILLMRVRESHEALRMLIRKYL